MRACASRWFLRRQLASALAGALALGAVALIPAGRTVAEPPLVGIARIIDGDTIEIAGERVRLEGIDAPELAQTCARSFIGAWACGEAAAGALRRLAAGRNVVCERQGTDKYGRTLAVCFAEGRDINAQMVREGFAWAFVRYSQRYVREERIARASRLGVWQGAAEPPWDFRAKRWAGAERAAPEGCAIKGNVSENGRIYHVPWGPWYEKVKIEVGKGERWFCSEAEALAAGWRPVAMH